MRSACPHRGLTLMELLVVLVILLSLSTLLIPTLSWIGERSQQIATLESLSRLRELLLNRYMLEMGELPRPRLALTGPSGTRANHPQLVYLFVNPDTHEDGNPDNDFINSGTSVLSGRRWEGPYVTHPGLEYYVTDTDSSLTTGTNFTNRYGVGDITTRVGDPTVTDAWGHPLVIQEPDADGNGTTDAIERQHTRIVSAGRNGIIDTPPDVLMPSRNQRVDDLVVYLFRHDEHGDDLLKLDQ